MAKTKIVVLGAGITGLGAATQLHQHQHEDWIVIERESFAGGLAKSVVDKEGFTWDVGAHVIFSHYNYFDALMDRCIPDWIHHHRESWIWCLDRFVPYPFQNNLHRLPEKEINDCVEGIRKTKELQPLRTAKPKDFQEWINFNFGEGLAKVFLNPYNFKVWAYHPEQMNSTWVGERVPTVDLEKILENIKLNRDELGWGPNATFRFPLHGGTGAIWKSVSKLLPQERFRFNTQVDKINVDQKLIKLVGGEEISYDTIISTMPIDILLDKIEGENLESLKEKKNSFRYSTSHVVGLGLTGDAPEELQGKCWIYFPESNCPFYRATLFSHFSPNNVPRKGTWSLMFEVSDSIHKPAGDNVVEDVIQGAINTKLIQGRDQIISVWYEKFHHGYPTPFVGRDELLQEVQPKLMEKGILSRGRFGGWKYEVGNQDHSLMQGVEAADYALLGIPEVTYFNPDLVNSKKQEQRSYKGL